MSRSSQKKSRITTLSLLQMKASAKKFSVVTCYDAAFAKIIDRSEIEMILVGDSLGNVILGHEDTIPVTMNDMVHHTRAVTRVTQRAMVCADMPFMSYRLSNEQALMNAARLVQEGGAQCVKLEGGKEVCAQVATLVTAGIPVVGHVGLTPQSVHSLGGFKVQARSNAAQERFMEDVLALEKAGAFAIVFEMIPKALAARATATLKIPTIGIGAGVGCDAQVLVLHDLLGFDAEFQPKFLKKYADLSSIVTSALRSYDEEVKSGSFPDDHHSFAE